MKLFGRISIGKIITIVCGSLLVLAVSATEFLSSTPNGIGPYQAILILLGICIFLLGILPPDHWTSRLMLVCGSFVVSVILLEGILLVAYRANVPVTYPDTNQLVNDDLLGKKTPPGAAGHDARGWRNPVAINDADIVTIGDSQTWGVNVPLEDAYPSVLSELSDDEVYNMAQGSYGAVQYRVLSEEAIELSPELVIVGMYFGNDFVDAYNIVYKNTAYRDLRSPNFNPAAITQTVTEEAIQFQPTDLTNLGQATASVDQASLTFDQQVRSGTYIGRFLTSIGVFEPVATNSVESQIATNYKLVAQSPDSFAVYEDGEWETFLTPAYRQVVQDLTHPIVREGIRITKLEYARIEDMMSDAGIELLVVLIPTKELVYAPYMETINDTYRQLIEYETRIRHDMIAFFEANDIQYLDALPSLQESVERDVRIYPSSFDGHPNANGYEVIAEAIWSYID